MTIEPGGHPEAFLLPLKSIFAEPDQYEVALDKDTEGQFEDSVVPVRKIYGADQRGMHRILFLPLGKIVDLAKNSYRTYQESKKNQANKMF